MAGVFDLELNEAQADLEDISDEEEAIEIADDQLEVMPLAVRPWPGCRQCQCSFVFGSLATALVQH